MSTLAPPLLRQHRTRLTTAQRIVSKHEELEALIENRRSHGLPTGELWQAMVQLEDRLQVENPRSYSHWLAIWLTRRPTTSHPRGSRSGTCPLCQDEPEPTQGQIGIR